MTGQRSSGLPVQHLRSASGIPICGARPRKQGWLFVERDPDCKGCQREQARVMGTPFKDLLARSSLGTPAVERLRRQTSAAEVAKVLARAAQLSKERL